MTRLITPMDVALAGLQIWRRQMQSAAVMGMRLSGLGAAWTLPPSEAMELVAKSQAEFAEASRRISLSLLDGAMPGIAGPSGRDGGDTGA